MKLRSTRQFMSNPFEELNDTIEDRTEMLHENPMLLMGGGAGATAGLLGGMIPATLNGGAAPTTPVGAPAVTGTNLPPFLIVSENLFMCHGQSSIFKNHGLTKFSPRNF